MNPISKWLKEYSAANGNKTFIVGVSGGVDSALVSSLCAETGIETWALSLPLHQNADQLRRATAHINWLKSKYSNVFSHTLDLSATFDVFKKLFLVECENDLGFANSKARLRMTALYQVAAAKNGLVVGTGNKIEDWGVGFFTKYGDGGVDISPIAHLMKSEVRKLALEFGVIEEIVHTAPTDGLWADLRTDEQQLGATYDELEWAMKHEFTDENSFTQRQREVLKIYRDHRRKNLHKMVPIPVFIKTPK